MPVSLSKSGFRKYSCVHCHLNSRTGKILPGPGFENPAASILALKLNY